MLSVRLVQDGDRAAIDHLIRTAFVSTGASVDSVTRRYLKRERRRAARAGTG